MAFIPFSGLVAKAAIEMALFGNTMVNTLWFEKLDETEWTSETLLTLCVSLAGWWEEEFSGAVSTSVDLSRVTAWKMDNAVSLYGEYTPPAPISGQLSGDCQPSGNCISVKFASSLAGRSYRGRNYVSGIPSGYVGGNAILGSYKTIVLNAYNTMEASVQADLDVNHIIASRYHNKAPRSTGVTVPVTAYAIVNLDLDSQRNRLNGRGA